MAFKCVPIYSFKYSLFEFNFTHNFVYVKYLALEALFRTVFFSVYSLPSSLLFLVCTR